MTDRVLLEIRNLSKNNKNIKSDIERVERIYLEEKIKSITDESKV